jgi:hypothetical protein
MKLTKKAIRVIIREEIKRIAECGCQDHDPMQHLDDALASGNIELARQILADIRTTEAPPATTLPASREMY